MKRENLKSAVHLCSLLDQMKAHYTKFVAIMTDELPESEFDLQQDYALKLQAKIKKIEKELANL